MAVMVNERALKASFEVSYLIATAMKLHNIAETSIFPAAIEMVRTMCREKEAQQVKMILLSETTEKKD